MRNLGPGNLLEWFISYVAIVPCLDLRRISLRVSAAFALLERMCSRTLESSMKIKKISKDDYLYRVGDVSNSLYVIRSGRFAITNANGQDERNIMEINAGDILGERDLIQRRPRSMNIRAVADSEVAEIPYDGLLKQIGEMPEWVSTIIKTLTAHLDRAIEFSRELYEAKNSRSPNGLAKYLSILNFVGLKYKRFSYEKLRIYTIQIFQEPTNKLQPLLNTLEKLGYLTQTQVEESVEIEMKTQKSQELVGFAEWYNEWTFKREDSRLPILNEHDLKLLDGILEFAEKAPANAKGFTKLNMTKIQETSETVLGYQITVEALMASLVSKKYLPQPNMEDTGIHVMFDRKELATLGLYCRLANVLGEALK